MNGSNLFCSVCYKNIPAENVNNPMEIVNHNGVLFHKKCCVCCCCHKETTQPNFLFCGIYCPECFKSLFSNAGFRMANSFYRNLWDGFHCTNCMQNFVQNFMKPSSAWNTSVPNFNYPQPGYSANTPRTFSGPSPSYSNVNSTSTNCHGFVPNTHTCLPQIYFATPWGNVPYFHCPNTNQSPKL